MEALNKIRYACLVCTLMALVTLAGCNLADRSAEPPQSSQQGSEQDGAKKIPLNVEVFNLGERSMFAVSSVLVTGLRMLF